MAKHARSSEYERTNALNSPFSPSLIAQDATHELPVEYLD